MSGVDYSKWDRMVQELSDSDSEGGQPPVVTTFDKPQTVTFGGDGATLTPTGARAGGGTGGAVGTGAATGASVGAGSETQTGRPAVDPGRQAGEKQRLKGLRDFARNGAEVRDGEAVTYAWSQSRTEVKVVVAVPAATRARDVEVTLASSEAAALGTADRLRVAVKGSLPALDGELTFPAKLSEDGVLDWQLIDLDDGRRGVEVAMAKHVPVEGVTLWWKALVKGDPEIDITAIQGRKTPDTDTWSQAMDMFKERVKKMKENRQEVDLS